MRLFLALVLALGLIIRGLNLSTVPPEAFGDELDVGYQAYSLLATGRDLYGQPLPVLLHSLSEWRLPLVVYYTVPSIALFGLTEVGVRLPEVVSGGLAAIVIFAWCYYLTRHRLLALISAILVTILPWHFLYSRMAAFGVVTQINFLLLGTLAFLRRRPVPAALFFAASAYVYGTSLVFVPLWLVAMWLMARRPIVTLTVVLVILTAPLTYHTIFGSAAARFNHLSVFSAPEVQQDIIAYRTRHPGFAGRLFYNRPVVYSRVLLRNYLLAFSPEFLFLRGDPVYRHSLQIVGGVYPVLAPFILTGLYLLARRRHYLPLAWLAIAPLPAALTLDGGYHATRLFLMLPPLVLAASLGIAAGISWIRRSKVGLLAMAAMATIGLFSLARVSYYYYHDYPVVSWRWWQIGYKQMFTEVARLDPQFSRVFVNNTFEPALVRFLFWTRFPPADFHSLFSLDQPVPEIMPGYDGFSLGSKYFFGQFSPSSQKVGISKALLPGALYLISQRDDVGGDWDWRLNPPDNVVVHATAVTPDGLPLLYLVSRR